MTESIPFGQLAAQAESIRQLCAGVDESQARWRPDADSWSMLEVINHLADEECADFRARLDCILHRPEEPWPPIDPAGRVLQRRFNQRDLEESLQRFSAARQESLVWLRSLGDADLNVSAPAPWGGRICAGDMLAAWVAHDLLHLRQLVELHYAWTAQRMQPWSVAYAGAW
ncbi:MAG: DinB family protein [Anaerolineaceae bacterium]|nr:DinB family protein [Anaerolineaceae bacterium]